MITAPRVHHLATVCVALVVCACRSGGTNAARDLAPRTTVTTCATNASATGPATLTLQFTVTPAISDSQEVSVRMEGETMRNTIRVSATQPSQFSLTKGVYVVRASLPGYTSAEGRVALSAGCEATMAMTLRKGGK